MLGDVGVVYVLSWLVVLVVVIVSDVRCFTYDRDERRTSRGLLRFTTKFQLGLTPTILTRERYRTRSGQDTRHRSTLREGTGRGTSLQLVVRCSVVSRSVRRHGGGVRGAPTRDTQCLHRRRPSVPLFQDIKQSVLYSTNKLIRPPFVR